MYSSADELFSASKYERVREMQRFGLNTPEYVLFERGDRSFQNWHPGTPLVSLRYYLPPGEEDSKFGTQPHSPRITWDEATALMDQYIDEFNIMVNPGSINPGDTIHCGNLQLELHSIDGFGIAIFEVCTGPFTVRDVTTRGRTLICNLHQAIRDEDGSFLNTLSQVRQKALRFPFWNHGIFEWSAYPYGVGRKSEGIIFWEFRTRTRRKR